jgi:hypothetical protein
MPGILWGLFEVTVILVALALRAAIWSPQGVNGHARLAV